MLLVSGVLSSGRAGTLYRDDFNGHGDFYIDRLLPASGPGGVTWTGNKSFGVSGGAKYCRITAGAAEFGSQWKGQGSGGSAWLPIADPDRFGALCFQAELTMLEEGMRAFCGFNGPVATNNEDRYPVWSQAPAAGLYLAFERAGKEAGGYIATAGLYTGTNQLVNLTATGCMDSTEISDYAGHVWTLYVDVERSTVTVMCDSSVAVDRYVLGAAFSAGPALNRITLAAEYCEWVQTDRYARFDNLIVTYGAVQ